MQTDSFSFSRKQAAVCVGTLVLFTGLVRLMLAYATVHYYDVNYYFDWSLGAAADFSGVYENVANMDYPPLFLYFLYFTGKILENESIQTFHPYVMILLKGWQILFDLAIGVLLYLLFQRRSQMTGLAACAAWLCNPSMICNSSYWGQTDSMMLFFLLASFALLTAQKPEWASVVMALACLAKFQSLYFAPVFLLALVSAFAFRRVLLAAGAGLLTIGAVFFPFLLRSGWDLPFRVYLGGFNSYPAASLNAFNYFSLLGLNRMSAKHKLLGGFSCEMLSWCAILLMLALLVYFYLTAREQSLWLLAFFGMQTIFIFTTRMHERYQVPVLLFCLAGAFTHQSKGLFAGYLVLTCITFANQFVVLQNVLTGGQREAWLSYFDTMMRVGGLVNLLVYAALVVLMVCIFYRFSPWIAIRNRFFLKKTSSD